MAGTLRLTRSAATAVLLGILTAAPSALAQSKDVEIQVLAIRATTSNSDISPELKELAEQLKKGTKFTGFKVEKKASGKAALASSYSADLISDYKVVITPTKFAGEKIQVKTVVLRSEIPKGEKTKKDTEKTSITITAERGKMFLPASGLKLDGDDMLIVAVAAR